MVKNQICCHKQYRRAMQSHKVIDELVNDKSVSLAATVIANLD